MKKILEYLVEFLEAQNDLFKGPFVYFMLNSQEFMVKGLSLKNFERSEGSKVEMLVKPSLPRIMLTRVMCL